MDVQNLSKENDGIRFLLILIDTLSKYLRIVALKQKSARDVLTGIKQVFESGVKCQTLRCDRGGEFRNRLLLNYLKMRELNNFLLIKIQRHLLQKELYVQFEVDYTDTFKKREHIDTLMYYQM